MDERRKAQANRDFERRVEGMDREKARRAAEHGEEKLTKLEGDRPGPLQALWEDLSGLIGMLNDYFGGRYRELPWRTVAMAAAAVAYFVSPIDAIPDFIPGLGYVDDAMVLRLCLRAMRGDMEEWRAWRARR